MILGLAAIYAWIHSTVIIFKKTNATGYEQGVLIAGLTGFILFIAGTI